jgi:hypothetical protein
MATIAERYAAATSYVRRAIAEVENRPFAYVVDPTTGLIEWYAGRTKTEPARNELAQIEGRWLRAANDIDRARVARDAELLADRVQENLPGAPQDRKRTNLFAGEEQSATPATSYYGAVADEAHDYAEAGRGFLVGAAQGVADVGKLLLLGGGVLLGIRVFGYRRERERRRPVQAVPTQRELQAALEAAANARDRRR